MSYADAIYKVRHEERKESVQAILIIEQGNSRCPVNSVTIKKNFL